MRWDIFCKVIDNHGDIGVCWRLAAQLGRRGEGVRLWVDDGSALRWMAPQGAAGVEVRAWNREFDAQVVPGDAVVEAFGCELPLAFQAALAARAASGRAARWINLEYLTAEPFAERNHLLPSPVLAGPAAGLTKRFFHPGFTPRTGGLLREPQLERRQQQFDRKGWLAGKGVAVAAGARVTSLFCYEPACLPDLLLQLASDPDPQCLLVTAGRAAAAMRSALAVLDARRTGWNARGGLATHQLPLLAQDDYDHLLWASDANFVRGEDSLVRALWAGRPFVWQAYPQEDGVHLDKVDALLDWMEAPGPMRDFFRAWNGGGTNLPASSFEAWRACASAASAKAWAQADLSSQLLEAVNTPA